MLPLQQEAGRIYTQLQSDERFEHFGLTSRHIVIPTETVTAELSQLFDVTIDPYARELLKYSIKMFDAVGDNGILFRIKNGTNIEIRGSSFIPDHEPSMEELANLAIKFDNYVRINLNGLNPMLEIGVPMDNDDLDETVNEIVKHISEPAKIALIKGFLGIASRQFDIQVQN